MKSPTLAVALAALGLASMALLACTEEVFEPTDQGPCTQNFECPTGYSCIELRCIRDVADAGADAGADSGADAAVDSGADVSGADALGEAAAGLSASCAEIASCAGTCADAGCVQSCAARAAAEPQRKFAEVVRCVEASCAHLAGEALSECQLRECSDSLESCFARPTGMGSEPCATVFRCVAGCDSALCADACVAVGTFEAQTEAVRLYECALPSCATERTADGYARCAANACAPGASRCGI